MFRFLREAYIDKLGSITGDPIKDFILAMILSAVIGIITYSKVGDLYNDGLISGSLLGKIAYSVIFILLYTVVFYVLVGVAGMLRFVGIL